MESLRWVSKPDIDGPLDPDEPEPEPKPKGN